MSRLLTRLSARGVAFRASRRGSIPILFALSLIPLIGLIGLGVDYGVATSNKAKLDIAADAAAIAAVVTAKAYIGDNAGQTDVTAKALAAGTSKAIAAFRTNMGNVALAQVGFPAPQVTRQAQTLTATVSYSATVQNTFGPIFGSPTTVISNTVTASADVASYLDFYLLLDVSGSMGLPTSNDGMNKLAALNNDMDWDYHQGCQFACHYPGNVGWGLAISKNIQLRSDAVNLAVCSLIQRAGNPVVPNQYRVGLYPFINQMGTLASITSNIATLNVNAQCGATRPLALTNLLDTGTTQLFTNNDPSTGTGSGGTHFELVLPQMKSTISPFGNGSTSTSSKPFVFLITDGMQNSQFFSTPNSPKRYYPGSPSKFSGYGDAWFDSSQSAAINPSQCNAIKDAGAIISILYIPYNIITFREAQSNFVIPENKKVNAIIPNLATAVKACASPGYFFTANTTADINSSLNAMFDKALQAARLTQ